MSDSRTSNVIKNSGASLIYKVCHLLLQFGMRTAFIYILGKEYAGVSTLFTDVLSVLSLMELGIATAITYALYKPLKENDGKRISALMNFYKKAYPAIGIGVLVVGILCIPFLSYIVHDVPSIREDIRLIFFMYLLATASSYFFVYKTVLIRADQKSRIISSVTAVVQIVEGVLEIIFLLITKEFFVYLVLRVASNVTRNLILSRKATKLYGQYLNDKDEKLTRTETKSLFKDIYSLGIYKISGVIINSTDSIVISAFIGTVEVAIIGNFTLIINSIRTTIEQIVEATKPSIGNLVASSTREKQKVVFDKMNFMAAAVSCFCCTCLYVLLNPFVGTIWFDSSYMISLKVIIVLTANFFIAIMVYPVEAFRTANGLFIQGRYRPAIMAALNIILDIIFVRFWGIFGVLLATTVSRVSTQVWFDAYLVYKHAFKLRPWSYYAYYIKMAVLTAVCCGLAGFLANLVSIGNVYVMFIYQMAVAVVVPLVILIGLFHKTPEFKWAYRLVMGKVRKIIK